MSRFSDALDSGRFVVTCELNPPKGVDLSALYRKAELLKGMVSAFNITDSAGSTMTMAPIAAAHLLMDRGIETIMQITCRDRNRLALQSELLAAAALGASNVLCMSGDPPGAGDHPDAKPVFDLDAVELLRAANALNLGVDHAGNKLSAAPSLFAGAVVNPGAPDMDVEVRRMEDKVKAGAKFFQSQAVYDPASFEKFVAATRGYNVPVLAGLIVLKSGNMARNLNANLPGVHVPDDIVAEMDAAEDRSEASIQVSARIIREVQEMCQGVHIMAIGWENRIPRILEGAGIVGAQP